ncbi:hypothetical protein [Cellulomonas fimi]|uniref:Uncharacterized protein n=1 Tax=Cellulomonas fimi TaxID=1708 RepID=A0A7Y0M1B1_CELFI|nr:hypothetical protein [Cellulomonas fimi]NMR21238.1 hypothetical protein [Cellulomonas fimi]
MRAVRCVAGLHAWKRHVVTDQGGPKSVYERCTRCGWDRTRFVALDPASPPPDPVDRITPGVA